MTGFGKYLIVHISKLQGIPQIKLLKWTNEPVKMLIHIQLKVYLFVTFQTSHKDATDTSEKSCKEGITMK